MIKIFRHKLKIKRVILFFLVLVLVVGIWHLNKPMPKGISSLGESVLVDSGSMDFLYDLTYEDNKEELEHRQEIFDEIIKNISKAKKYILIDMFLFNSWLGNTEDYYRPITSQITEALINAKKNNPDIKIDLISDPINVVYGGDRSDEFDRLKNAGVNVILTDLKPLRDSNPVYSSFWRVFLQWLGNDTWPAWVKHPFSEKDEKVSLRSYLSLLNFKANHRKTFLADSDDSYVSIISSANPHTSSSAHSNVAVEIEGSAFAKTLLESEWAVAKMSGNSLHLDKIISKEENTGDSSVQLITEGKIKEKLMSLLKKSVPGDEIDIAMFYLSDRDIVNTLKNTVNRGISVRLIMDSNKDAFGYEKGGIPNREVTSELLKKTDNKIKIRWYYTHGEQFHSKITYIKRKNGEHIVVLGSANLTRRNIGDYNLETDVEIISKESTNFTKKVEKYFNNIWENREGNYTTIYSSYRDDSFWKKIIYRFQEFSGLSSF